MRLSTLWVSGPLSYIEVMCLRSAVAVGHDVHLYSYHGVPNLPEGITEHDAREVLPESEVTRYGWNRSLALGSDRFRYRLLEADLGCWIDADVLLLRPIPIDREYIFGWEDAGSINGAVLKLPPRSEMLADLLQLAFSDPVMPPWLPDGEKEKLKERASSGDALSVQYMPWGTIGPKAITHFAKHRGLDRLAASPEVFYPVHWTEADAFFDPSVELMSRLRPSTIGVHMWSHLLDKYKNSPPPSGSFTAKMLAEHKGPLVQPNGTPRQ